MSDNTRKWTKTSTIKWDDYIIVLVALDHLKAEYQCHLEHAISINHRDAPYWREQITRVESAYAGLQAGETITNDAETEAVTA
jgi:S-methylmethionine-dependent homocysteine/selenocysteine methylase